MGIYIKNVEMPKSCGNCFFDSHCDNWRIRNWGAPPPDDCPLVPVQPHGNLIDVREAIIDANERGYDFWLSDDEINSTIQFLNEQTTIIPAEEGET